MPRNYQNFSNAFAAKDRSTSAQTIDKGAGEAMLLMLWAYRASIGNSGAIEEMSYL